MKTTSNKIVIYKRIVSVPASNMMQPDMKLGYKYKKTITM